MGIPTQASTGGQHIQEAWLAASSLIQAMPFVLILSLVAKDSHHVPPQSWSGKFIVKIQVEE